MSILFLDEHSNQVWFPGNVSARVFHGQVHSVARLMEVEAGLGPIERDEIIVDREKFLRFVSAFAEFMRKLWGTSSARTMLAPCFSIAAALARKLGAKTEEYGLDDLVEQGRHHMD